MHPRRDAGREVLAGCGRRERCQRAISRPLLGCECCVNQPEPPRRDRAGYRAGMRRVTILTIVATLVPVAVALRRSVDARVGGHGARRLHRQPRHHVLRSRPRSSRFPTVGSWCSNRVAACAPGFPGQAMPTVLTLPNICPRWRAWAARVHPRSRLPHQPPRLRVLHARRARLPRRLRQPREPVHDGQA